MLQSSTHNYLGHVFSKWKACAETQNVSPSFLEFEVYEPNKELSLYLLKKLYLTYE